MKIKQKTVADKVNELLAREHGSNSEEDATEARVTEYDSDEYELPAIQTTEFRKRNTKLLSEQSAKYKGKISSRKDFEDEEEEEQEYEASDSDEEVQQSEKEEENSDDELSLVAFSKKIQGISNNKRKTTGSEEEEEEEDVDNDDDDDVNDEDDKEGDTDDDDDKEDDDGDEDVEKQPLVSEKNRQTEVQKGICVQNQLQIWEKLLEIRIQSQKILTKANQLPNPEEFQTISHDFTTEKNTTVQNVSTLLHKLLHLQQTLSQQFEEISKTAKKRAINETNNTDEPLCKRLGLELAENFQTFTNYRNEVLLKWDDRTKLLTPGASSKRKSAQEDFDILKKVAHALNNRSGLKQHSQQLKTETVEKAIGNSLPQIYDDSDFYHQQLRELIEYKANTSNNMSEVTKQYVELQKLRQKMKKKVDTRASKGRKIRYAVHNKLVNFMAPEDSNTWTDQSKDELYRSLFVAT